MAHIKTYCRIKPTKSSFTDYQISPNTLRIQVPENLRESVSDVNIRQRPAVNHQFKFTYVFNEDASQEDVFNKVAKEIVEGFLAGYNGTIFAYGQTGTGKTYTVEGSARRYKDRGLAPRAISMIYNALESRQGEEIDIHVSYMEIYQEVGYDLLTPVARLGTIVTSFPKVSVVEGPQGSCVIRNLSQHLAASEDIAQSLLIEGQANRQVAETSMNQRSSRSHAVFTIQLSVKKPNDDMIIRSKLHLVDLAGSERVSKTRIEGQQLAEAKYINLSLHHLESVIIALQQKTSTMKVQLPTPNFMLFNRVEFKARLSKEKYASNKAPRRCSSAPSLQTVPEWMSSLRNASSASANPLTQSTQQTRHIPYRNSLLTMVLRDSLGGNCQTAMIATVTFEEESLGETISTCRFAQRVACITNVVSKNEELDDKSLIKRLRRRVAELETELALLREGLDLPAQIEGSRNKLTEDEKLKVARTMQNYLMGHVTDPISAGITTPAHFRESLRLLRRMILNHYVQDNNDKNAKVVLDGRTQKSVTAAPPNQNTQQLPPVSSPTSSSSRSPSVVPMKKKEIEPKLRSISPQEGKHDPAGQMSKVKYTLPSFNIVTRVRPQTAIKKSEQTRAKPPKLVKATQRINDISSDSDQSQNSTATRSHLVNTKDNATRVKPVQNAVHSSSRDIRQHIPPHARSSGMTAKQVMEELKAQEQPQNKTKNDVEMKSIYARRQEMEQLEMATRKRLSDLKEKIQQAKRSTTQARKHDSGSEHSDSGVDVMTKPQIPSNKSAFTGTHHLSTTRGKITAADVPSNIVEVEKPSKHVMADEDQRSNYEMTEPERLTNQHQTSQFDSASVMSLAGSVSPYRYQSDVTKPSHKEYTQPKSNLGFIPASRTSSVCSKNAHELELMYLERKRNISEMWGVESTTQSRAAYTPVVPDFVGGDISRTSMRPISAVPVPDQGYEETPRVNSVIPRTASEQSFDIGRSNSETDICDAEVRRVFLENKDEKEHGDDSGSESVKPQPTSVLDRASKASTKLNTNVQPSQPSALVGHFTKQDGINKTSAAEADFSHKDFDKALQKMLGTDTLPTLSYTHDDYDKFARPTKPTRTRCKTAKAANRTQNAAAASKPLILNETNKPKEFNPWGPEARGMTVGERIARLVKEASRNTAGSKSDGASDAGSFIPPPSPDFSVLGSGATNNIHESRARHKKPSVKALDEKDREAAYMSTMKAERLRLARIQRARSAAEVIQRSWRRYKNRHR